MKKCFILLVVIGGLILTARSAFAGDHRIGAGIHYWHTIDEIKGHNFDNNGYSWVFSYQYKPTIVGFQADVDFTDIQLGDKSKMMYSPQAYVIVGGFIYGGAGIGFHYFDGDSSNPFYALKAGFDFEPLPKIHLDINGNYRFDNWDYHKVKEDISTDTVTLAAIVRLEF